MYNFFIDKNSINGNEIYLSGENFNHAKNVLRMRVGDEFLISYNSVSSLCKITDVTKSEIVAQIINENCNQTNLPINVYLFQGLPKSDKMELIIQKAVELGVYEIIPVETKRSIVKLDGKKADGKISRWQSISESAAKQSKRNVIPTVSQVLTFNQALEKSKQLDLVILPYENKEGMSATLNALKQLKSGMTVGIFIGPEGGFEQSEVDACEQIGAKIISLGKRILRTETAAITTLSMLMLYAETFLS